MKMTSILCLTNRRSCGGFSLIEMIVAITVLGILSTSAAVFLRGPIGSYFDTERRATLADAGGLAMARLGQDVSGAAVTGVTVLAPPPGGGFRFRITQLPANVIYTCTNQSGTVSGTLRRASGPNNNLLAEGVRNCQARLSLAGIAVLLGTPGIPGTPSALVAVELNLRSEDAAGNDMGDRLNLVRTFRVGPLL
ncbi:MAG: hypothetical protein B7Z35_14765 [Hydrogenophilales bacterium 12-61-10]|nr:MAG: hypothetical protein B7Z35_14765 [Hydrogenophilales bacterium 12-61-10]